MLTHAGSMVGALAPEAIEEFQLKFRGPLIKPGDERYDEVRQVWNGMIDKRPALIARCTGSADVVAAINFARSHNLPVSVRGGGHNAAGNAVCDDGLMIDLSLMKGIHVDPHARTARAEAGVTWAELDRETQAFGLATPGGVVSTTGIAGLTLGGGHGWLRRKYGLACDNLLSADIITAAGQFLTASETENSDLFWAIRGGGGNFGIVTSFEYRLHPVGPEVMAGVIFYPFAAAKTVLAGWRDFMASAPDEISSNANLWSIPPTPHFPAELHWQPMCGVAALYAGPVEAGQQALQPLRELADPIADASAPLPFTVMQAMFDPFFPKGELNYYWKSLNLSRLDDEAIATLIAYAQKRPSPMSLIDVWAMGGAVKRIGAQETAFGDRSAPFTLVLNTSWPDPKDSDRNIAWTRTLWSEMRQFSSGNIYLNFPGLGEDNDETVKKAYGPNYDRLVRLKNKYDPENFFHLNQNIKPSK